MEVLKIVAAPVSVTLCPVEFRIIEPFMLLIVKPRAGVMVRSPLEVKVLPDKFKVPAISLTSPLTSKFPERVVAPAVSVPVVNKFPPLKFQSPVKFSS